ncbi:DUF3293 domain-containing protein [Brytella acorum]|uniref:DUF3293 domain-containing protein n=1 Tax=Brytella acorum TaxID=2959299 RepID=A0AA35UPY3_9PROT|nr:DUF3293 domain-containing protein [Brytella acorum]MDF3623617.1 DUF3293 domain-containing protein [Brytella acorum]CAI9119965.1 DUF3293 domain-containing protein [Brytella acorum]
MNLVRPPTDAAIRAYRRSHYVAPGLDVRIGRPPRGWPLPGASIVLLSACNPSGRRLSAGLNAWRMSRLEVCLDSFPYLRGEGRLGRWSETLFAVAMPLRRACVVARRFGQNAVVALAPNHAARLVWLA